MLFGSSREQSLFTAMIREGIMRRVVIPLVPEDDGILTALGE